MNAHTHELRDNHFAIGLLTGACLGAGLAIWFGTDSARRLGERASEEYALATARLGAAVDELTRKGQGVCDDVADAVARGAHEVERYAASAKTTSRSL
jgi:hypothetical protein